MQLSSGTTKALIGIVVVLVAVVAYRIAAHGREAEAGFVIQGQPRASLIQSANADTTAPAPSTNIPNKQTATQPSESPKAPEKVVVHVAGAVKKPGVYRFEPDARAEDAIKQAGGVKENANLDAINLAARLEDGQQLYVPTKAEHPDGGAPVDAGKPAAGKTGASPAGAHGKSGSSKFTSPGQGTVNINTASGEQLERLPGVGPAMSARIIEFRKENGPFTAPEGLMDVSGIGEKKFAKMKPFVRVR